MIESIAGVTERRDPKLWKALWQKDPKALWAKIKAINDAFVANLPQLAQDEQRKIDKKLFNFRHGFLTLDGDLVERLGKRGLLWGAVFSERIDLQHFELE